MIEARRDQIKSVQAFREATLKRIDKCADCPALLVANISMKNFRVTYAPANLAKDGHSLILDAEVAAGLRLEEGDPIGYLDPNGAPE